VDADVLIPIAFRAIFGLFLAAILGAVGFLVIWFVWNPTGTLTPFIAALVTSALDKAPADATQSFSKPAQRERRVAALDPKIPASIEDVLKEEVLNDDADPGWNSGWAPAPDFDEDHPEELSYRPFPVAPFMTQSASPDDSALIELVRPDVMRTLELLDEQPIVLPLRLRPGPQVAQVMWAQQFRGQAVDMTAMREAQNMRNQASRLASRPVRTTSR